jgi:hypothetical protein
MANRLLGDPGRFASLLQRLLDSPGRGVPDPDFALATDAEIVEKVRRDPVIAKAINQRLHQVAETRWHIEAPTPASQPLVPIFTALVGRIERFADARLNLARAVFEGTRWAWMGGRSAVTKLRGEAGEPALRWWWVQRLDDVDKRRLRLDWRPGRDAEAGSTHDDAPIADVAPGPMPEAGRGSMCGTSMTRSPGNGRRSGSRNTSSAMSTPRTRGACATAVGCWSRSRCIGARRQRSSVTCARGPSASPTRGSSRGSPIRPRRPTSDAELGPAAPTAEERAEALVRALGKMRQASILVLDEQDHVDAVDLSGDGNRLILDLIRYVDRCMVELILGASMPTGSGTEGGSLARARVEAESTGALLRFDREALEDTLNRDLIGALWRYNQPALRELGLAELPPPRLRIGEPACRDAEQALATVKEAARIGLPLQRDEVYAALGFTPPAGVGETLTWGAPGMTGCRRFPDAVASAAAVRFGLLEPESAGAEPPAMPRELADALEASGGCVIALTGPSGAGKSRLLAAIRAMQPRQVRHDDRRARQPRGPRSRSRRVRADVDHGSPTRGRAPAGAAR